MTTNVGVCYFKLICMLRDKKDDENKKKTISNMIFLSN